MGASVRTEKENIAMMLLYSMFFVYVTSYGTTVIYFEDNLLFKSIKEIVLILITIKALVYFSKSREPIFLKHFILIFVLLSVLLTLNYLFNIKNNDIFTFLYGVKISFLPMVSIIIGRYLIGKNIEISRIVFLMWFFLISAWILQKVLGLEWLLNNGFEYGINVKHFTNGELRLPSLVGTPDNYAFLLSIFSCFLLYINVVRKKYFNATVIFTISSYFLFLSTIRSALLFFLIFIIFYGLITSVKSNRKNALIIFIAFSISLMFVSVTLYVNPLLSTYSLEDRFTNWIQGTTPLLSPSGLIGNGLGTVGSADTSISLERTSIKGEAIDNQYLAYYEQLGALGLFFLVLAFSIIIKLILARTQNVFIYSVIVAVIICGFFTNLLEIYPFNLFLWLLIGLNLKDELQ